MIPGAFCLLFFLSLKVGEGRLGGRVGEEEEG